MFFGRKKSPEELERIEEARKAVERLRSDEHEEPCPGCGTMIARGAYVLHDVELDDKPTKAAAPNDVECPTCKFILRHTVPLYATRPSGWEWRIIHPEVRRPYVEPEPKK